MKPPYSDNLLSTDAFKELAKAPPMTPEGLRRAEAYQLITIAMLAGHKTNIRGIARRILHSELPGGNTDRDAAIPAVLKHVDRIVAALFPGEDLT